MSTPKPNSPNEKQLHDQSLQVPDRIREEDMTPFLTTPWCLALLRDPTYETYPSPNRRPPPPLYNTCSSSFFSKTLWTPSTLSSAHLFRLAFPSNKVYPYQHHHLYALGEDLDGMTGRMHGGVVSTLLDHELGILATVAWNAMSTAKLEVEFLRPVSTPGIVLVRAWLERVEGRKCWVSGVLQNGEGKELARGKGVFVRPRGQEGADGTAKL